VIKAIAYMKKEANKSKEGGKKEKDMDDKSIE